MLRFATTERLYLDDSDRIEYPFEVWDFQAEENRTVPGYGVEFDASTVIPISMRQLFGYQFAEFMASQVVLVTNPPTVLKQVMRVDESRVRVLFSEEWAVDDFIKRFNGFIRRQHQRWRGGEPPQWTEASTKTATAIDPDSIEASTRMVDGIESAAWRVPVIHDNSPYLHKLPYYGFKRFLEILAKDYGSFLTTSERNEGAIIDVWFGNRREAEFFVGGLNRGLRNSEHGWRGGEPPEWTEASMQLRFAVGKELIEGELPPEEEWEEFQKTEPIDAVKMEEDFTVDTLEGEMKANKGDWLARGIEDELWPVDGDIFEKTYEPTGDE